MNQDEIKFFLLEHEPLRQRTIVIVDFGNVDKWKNSLGWRVGIQELALLVKHFSRGRRFLRRFYYGADYGPHDSCQEMVKWSEAVLRRADINGFEVVSKRVKYIRNAENVMGFEKKCDLDVEMTVDLMRERDNYDKIILFSGDGDLAAALKYLKEIYNKNCIVMSARGHLGKEIIDANRQGVIEKIIFAEDFEYRLNMDRFRLKSR